MKNKSIKKKQTGQVLLLTVMLIATVVTVVMTTAFRTTTDIQTTKLEEESQKALAGAEAGIEAALKKSNDTYSFNLLGLPSMSGIDKNASKVTVSGNLDSHEFTSPIIQKDEQYTYYFSDYATDPGLSTSTYTGVIQIYFGTEVKNSDCSRGTHPALELTILYSNDGAAAERKVIKYAVDPCNQVENAGGTAEATGLFPIAGTDFYWKKINAIDLRSAPFVNGAEPRLLIIRSLFAATKIGVVTDVGNVLPTQGKYIVSEAKSTTGVTRKIQLFQSYPQLPAEYFVTSL